MDITKRAQVLNLIRQCPGIREPEIREELDLNGAVQAYIKPDLDRGHVLVERIELENGKHVSSFRENVLKPLELDAQGNVAGRAPARRAQALLSSSSTIDASADVSVSATGVMTISKAGKSMVLNAMETARIVAYLDRVNIEQILADIATLTHA